MLLSDYNYKLPPEYPQIRKQDQQKWGKILDLLLPVDEFDPPFLNEDFEEKISIKKWIEIKLVQYFEKVFDFSKTSNRKFKRYGTEEILPCLIEINRESLEEKWIFFMIKCYVDFITDHDDLSFPENLSEDCIELLNKSHGSNKILQLSGDIIVNKPSEHRIKENIDRYFPYYNLPVDKLMEIDYMYEPEYQPDLREFLEWLVFCDHLNYISDSPREVEAALEEALYSIDWRYGTHTIFKWLKHFQYYLDNNSSNLDSIVLPIVRRWLNTSIEYYYRQRNYFPLQDGTEVDPDPVKLSLLSFDPNEDEAHRWFDSRILGKSNVNYSAFEKALIIYLKEEYREISVTGKGYDAFKPLVIDNSHKSVANSFYELKRYLDPSKESNISSGKFKSALDKIIEDKSLKMYHGRAKNLLMNNK